MSLDEKNPDTNEVTADNSSDEKDINNIDEESVFGRNSAQSDSFVSDESDMGDMGSDEINLSSSDEAVKKDVDDDFKKKKGSVKRKALLLLLFLLLGGAAIIIIPKLGSSKAGEDDVDNISGQIYQGLPEGFDEAELLKKMQEKTDKSAFTINVNSRPIFANGSAKARIDIVNNPGNNYPCKVDIRLTDTNEVIYQNSDLMYPDQHIPYIRLSSNLKKGVYDAVLTYYIYDEEGASQIGTLSAGLEIIIQN